MKYAISARKTEYRNILFRSRLEAQWAAFFDLIEWKWEYEPIDLVSWTPDFRVEFKCGRPECGGWGSEHSLLIEVKPFYSIDEFIGHPCMDYPYGVFYDENGITEYCIPADASAAFGINPSVTQWEMCHGAGGGVFTIENWIGFEFDIDMLWKQANMITRRNYER